MQVVINFGITWRTPTIRTNPAYDAISMEKENAKVLFIKVDVEKNREVATLYKARRMPTFVFMKRTKEIARVIGPHLDQLNETVRRLA